MTLQAMLNKPVTLQARTSTTVDKYNQPVWVESTVDGVCYAQIITTDDDPALSRDQLAIRLYLPIQTDLDGVHAVEVDGEVFDMQGVPFQQWNPRLGRHEYWVLNARRAA